MTFSTFIVIDSQTSLQSIKESRTTYKYTMLGTIMYPFNTPLPVIRSGKGCIGIATIKSVYMTESSTTIEFAVTQLNPDNADAKAYYALYKNTATMNQMTSDDPYSNTEDTVIPGAMLTKAELKQPRRRRSFSLMDDDDVGYESLRSYSDDDDDDDDF